MSDIVWAAIGFAFGYIIGSAQRPRASSEELETRGSEILRLQEDIVYYKRLTKNLVEENKELRKKINAT